MRKRPESPHDRLVARGFRWLQNTQKCRPVFAEMTTAAGATPDVIGWHYGASRLLEAKTSRSDFFGDKAKLHSIHPEYSMGRKRWYIVPDGLVKAEDLPEGWGLLYVQGVSVIEIVEAPERLLHPLAQEQEVTILASAIRRFELGVKFSFSTGRWESYRDGVSRKRMEATLHKAEKSKPPVVDERPYWIRYGQALALARLELPHAYQGDHREWCDVCGKKFHQHAPMVPEV